MRRGGAAHTRSTEDGELAGGPRGRWHGPPLRWTGDGGGGTAAVSVRGDGREEGGVAARGKRSGRGKREGVRRRRQRHACGCEDGSRGRWIWATPQRLDGWEPTAEPGVFFIRRCHKQRGMEYTVLATRNA